MKGIILADGSGRKGNTEFIRFLYIALGSLSELETPVGYCNYVEFYPRKQ